MKRSSNLLVGKHQESASSCISGELGEISDNPGSGLGKFPIKNVRPTTKKVYFEMFTCWSTSSLELEGFL